MELAAASGKEALGRATIGLVVPYSPEYRQRSGNPALLELIARDTGGAVLTSSETVFEHNLSAVSRAQEIGFPLLLLVALLLPFDIGVRRLGLRRRDFTDGTAEGHGADATERGTRYITRAGQLATRQTPCECAECPSARRGSAGGRQCRAAHASTTYVRSSCRKTVV